MKSWCAKTSSRNVAQNSKQEKLKLDLNVLIFLIFQSKPKPTQADLYENNNSQNRYEPSTKPPINYKAPSIAFQLPEINDALEPERVKGQADHMFSRFPESTIFFSKKMFVLLIRCRVPKRTSYFGAS